MYYECMSWLLSLVSDVGVGCSMCLCSQKLMWLRYGFEYDVYDVM